MLKYFEKTMQSSIEWLFLYSYVASFLPEMTVSQADW